jgi:hypothetical protein
MQVVKNAYVSRHYTQCAKFGERLLAEVQGEVSKARLEHYMVDINVSLQIHPIHLSYLNFYTALSHDTLAREAPLEYSDRGLASPASSTSSQSSEGNVIWKFRRAGSVDSTASFASSTTSVTSSRADLDYTHRSMGSYSFPSPPQHLHTHSRKRSIIIPSRPQTPEEYQFAADTAAFVRMVRSHLSDVRLLKQGTNAPQVRFRFSSEMSSPVKSRVNSSVFDGEEVRRERMTRKWRPRFDPGETQRLCGEALAELGD